MTNTRLVKYMPWLARDYFFWAGIGTFIIIAGIGALQWKLVTTQMAARGLEPTPEVLREGAKGLAMTLTMMLAVLGPTIATGAIVSRDREHGYFRFLFARPVGMATYYAASFAMNGLGFLVICGLLALALWGFVAPVHAPMFLPAMLLSYVFIGGIIFLLSAVLRREIIFAVLLYFIASATWGTLDDGGKNWVTALRPVFSLMPPVHRHLRAVSGSMNPELVVGSTSVWWVAGYGLICFALGLVLIRRRGLAAAA
jgi:hypothetical protein